MTQSYHNYTTIYTAFSQSDKLPHLVKSLYLFVRSYDRQSFVKRGKSGEKGKGAGIVVLDIPTIAATLKRKESTIKKNLRLALKQCGFSCTEGDRPAHPPTIGDEPMSQVERNRRYRARKKAELVAK